MTGSEFEASMRPRGDAQDDGEAVAGREGRARGDREGA
jgi:hypothetical protein